MLKPLFRSWVVNMRFLFVSLSSAGLVFGRLIGFLFFSGARHGLLGKKPIGDIVCIYVYTSLGVGKNEMQTYIIIYNVHVYRSSKILKIKKNTYDAYMCIYIYIDIV